MHKRNAYRKAYHGFHIDRVAAMTESDVEKLLSKTSENSTELVVGHRGKLMSVINNAKVIQKLKGEKAIPSLKSTSGHLWKINYTESMEIIQGNTQQNG